LNVVRQPPPQVRAPSRMLHVSLQHSVSLPQGIPRPRQATQVDVESQYVLRQQSL